MYLAVRRGRPGGGAQGRRGRFTSEIPNEEPTDERVARAEGVERRVSGGGLAEEARAVEGKGWPRTAGGDRDPRPGAGRLLEQGNRRPLVEVARREERVARQGEERTEIRGVAADLEVERDRGDGGQRRDIILEEAGGAEVGDVEGGRVGDVLWVEAKW